MTKLLKTLSAIFFCLWALSNPCCASDSPFSTTENLPVAYQGRFRSLDSAARLWLYETYHKQKLKKSDLSAFNVQDPSAVTLLWMVHFFGHDKWDHAPFFWVHYAKVKNLLNLDQKTDRFSFSQLFGALYDNRETNLQVIRFLLPFEFSKAYLSPVNRSKQTKLELTSLAHGLWVIAKNNALSVAAKPNTPPWNFLVPGMVLSDHLWEEVKQLDKAIIDEILQLFQSLQTFLHYNGSELEFAKDYETTLEQMQQKHMAPNEIVNSLENQYPLKKRLENAGETLKMLPSKFSNGEWFSLHAFKIRAYQSKEDRLAPLENFTAFPDNLFEELRFSYLAFEKAVKKPVDEKSLEEAASKFTDAYAKAYSHLEGKTYKEASNKSLQYPSALRLKAETYYHKFPFIDLAICAYFISLLLFLASYFLQNSRIGKWALTILLIGFLLHSIVLALRCYILERPPVSNMFETVVYVPWIALFLGWIFYLTTRSKMIITAAALASLSLLILLKLTQIDAKFENVQAVLDSQYWLIIHVLMVVGSYGAFVVSGVLGHFYLIVASKQPQENACVKAIAKGILHTMYVGIAMLIPGTILGGIWAAESWGRFWDWDPKESWAFISACVYILVIHAYTFKKIRDFGLAIGSIVGLMAISFTWYGVNYVLGTGLHSYGFGKGGEEFYYFYLGSEVLFLTVMFFLKGSKKQLEKN